MVYECTCHVFHEFSIVFYFLFNVFRSRVHISSMIVKTGIMVKYLVIITVMGAHSID